MKNVNNNATIRRIETLAEHRGLLKYVFNTAQRRILVVSPFISSSALQADDICDLVREAVARGVTVTIYADDSLNRENDGSFKQSASDGMAGLTRSGATVTLLSGIHNKTLAMDSTLIAEGSFNWLSAVRTAGGVNQREERTLVVEGERACGMIETELSSMGKMNGGVVNVHHPFDDPTGKETKYTNIAFSVIVLLIGAAMIAMGGMVMGSIVILLGGGMLLRYTLQPVKPQLRSSEFIKDFTLDSPDAESICDFDPAINNRLFPGPFYNEHD